MEKNRIYTILLIIFFTTIAIAIIGLLITVLINPQYTFWNWNDSSKSSIIYEKTYNIDSFEQMQIDTTSTDIIVKPSDSDEIKIVIYGKKGEDVNSTIEDDTLIVTKSTKNQFCFGFCFYNKDEIVLYLPSQMESTLTIKTNSGDINIQNFENLSLIIKTSSGDIETGIVKDVELITKSGDVEVDTSSKAKIQTSSGEVKIRNFQILESSSIETSSGDVYIHEITDSYIDAKTNSGDIQIKEGNRFSEVELHIKTSSGDITVK